VRRSYPARFLERKRVKGTDQQISQCTTAFRSTGRPALDRHKTIPEIIGSIVIHFAGLPLLVREMKGFFVDAVSISGMRPSSFGDEGGTRARL
jgi:hypothetical protein